jgi:hypothetical protein
MTGKRFALFVPNSCHKTLQKEVTGGTVVGWTIQNAILPGFKARQSNIAIDWDRRQWK